MKKLLTTIAVGAFAFFAANTASAATVQFDADSWVDQDGTSIAMSTSATLTDDGLGNVLVDIAVSALSVVSGDILRVAFDGLLFTTVTNVTTNTGDGVTVNCNTCGGGNTGFTGGSFKNQVFDTIVDIGGTGSSTGSNTNISFLAMGVSAEDANAVALRVQTVTGLAGTTSLKLINTTTDIPNEVPLPAAGFLLIGGLGALGLMRRRQTA